MNRYLVIFITLCLSACMTKDERYYRSNPQALQKAMSACPAQQPQGLNCSQLRTLSTRMNRLAYQLQYNPQGFGHHILDLQEKIASQEEELKTNKTDAQLQTSLKQNKMDLADCLAVVKWLESPES